MINATSIQILPLIPQRWDDFETLFGPKGACAGCWCMFFIVPTREYNEKRGDGLRDEMHKLVFEEQRIPGLIAYVGDEPAGWIAFGPREYYSRLQRSRVLKAVDDLPVWSIVCFFVDKKFRKMGINQALIRAVLDFGAEKCVKIFEAYPYDVQGKRMADIFAYTGFSTTFSKAGFVEVARRSPTRPIMRYYNSI